MESKIIVDKISSGDEYTILLDSEHTLWGFGSNENGRLGLGKDVFNVFHPHKIEISQPILDIQSQYSHSLATSIDGDLFEWGHLADQVEPGIIFEDSPYNLPVYSPQKVEGFSIYSRIFSICCGFNYNAVLLSEGLKYVFVLLSTYLYSWGMALNSEFFSEWCDKPFSIDLPEVIKNPCKIVKMKSGYEHLIILDTEGDCQILGSNMFTFFSQ